MENISFSRYKNINSVVHKIDPITKFICFVLLTTLIFLCSSLASLISVFIFMVLGCLFARVKIKVFFTSILFVIPFFVMMLIFYSISIGSLETASIVVALMTFRIYIFILLAVIYTSTTKETEIAASIEWIITPLRLIRVPTYEIAMIITLAIRFVPLMIEDVRMIMIAQTSRGVNVYNGSISVKFKGLVKSLLPMLVLAFKRSEDISNAMVIRGYKIGNKRVKYNKNKFLFLELLSIISIIILYIIIFKHTNLISIGGY